jgi:dihydrofolate reductase
MKVILYMASTANGFIAKRDDDTSWISKEEWDSYSAMIREKRCSIIGHRTYDILTKQQEFSELKDVRLIVVARHDITLVDPRHAVAHSPKEALELAKDFKEVVVAGGGILNASFFAENLVDEIYLDVEPIIFSPGIPLFGDKAFEKKLELVGQKRIGDNGTQLHYRVMKNTT